MAPTAADLGRQEQALLLYLETRAVDYGGVVDAARLNAPEDQSRLAALRGYGLIAWGQIAAGSAPDPTAETRSPRVWVELTPAGWDVAQALRRARAGRGLLARSWAKVGEKRT